MSTTQSFFCVTIFITRHARGKDAVPDISGFLHYDSTKGSNWLAWLARSREYGQVEEGDVNDESRADINQAVAVACVQKGVEKRRNPH